MKHLAPVAATQSDTNSGLARIIELSAKWKDKARWKNVQEAARTFGRCCDGLNFSTSIIIYHLQLEKRLQKRSTDSSLAKSERNQAWKELLEVQRWKAVDLEMYTSESQRYGDGCMESRNPIDEVHKEFLELANLVREYMPQLLECVPDVDFLDEPADADHSSLRRNLRKLESEARVLSADGGVALTIKRGGRSGKPHPEDQKRLEFYEARKAEDSRLTHKMIAILWCEESKDICDEGAFKQSIYRARRTK